MNKLFRLLSLVFVFFSISSCDKMLLEKETPNDPVNTFDYVWNDFDQLYGLFLVKNTNWDSLYNIYRPMVNSNSSDKELYDALGGLLDHLNDGHVWIMPTNPELKRYNSSTISKAGSRNDFNVNIIKDNYLLEAKEFGETISYGKFPDNIGYIYIGSMSNDQGYYEKAMNKVLAYLKDTKAIIIDVRHNGGGWDKTTSTIGGRLFTTRTLFMKLKRRNGPNHTDFSETIEYYIEPCGDFQYTNPIVLLTNRESCSAAETFALGMKLRENTIQIGDTTEGAYADAITREMPNGWLYGISIGDYRDCNNVNWEGIGVPPDIVVQNDSVDVKNGTDKTLETAIDYLNKL
jgi:carboxyl-terminal processing protease